MKNRKTVFKVSRVLLILSICLAMIPTPAYADDYYSDDYYDEQFYKDFLDIMGGEYTFSYLYGISINEWYVLSNEEKAEYQAIYNAWIEEIKKQATEESLARDPSRLLLDYDIELAIQQAEADLYSKWYESLPYSEQMRILSEDWEIHSQWEKAANEKAAAEAAATAAAPIKLVVNGRTIQTDSPPVVESGRTLAPVRAIVEALGYIVAWDSATQTVDVYDPDTDYHRISMKIGSNRVKVSTGIWGVMDERIIDVPAKVINGRTMVPVRFIAETLGCSVDWDQATKTVIIRSNAG